MLKKEGHGDNAIANIIKENHPEIKELSLMAVRRALDTDAKDTISKRLAEGKNPLDEMHEEFKLAVDANTKKINELYDIARTILKKSMEDGSYSDQAKTLSVAMNGLSQEIKNLTVIQQYCARVDDSAQKVNLQKEQQVKILLVKWINVIKEETCPVCKEKVISKVIKLIDLENEEVEER